MFLVKSPPGGCIGSDAALSFDWFQLRLFEPQNQTTFLALSSVAERKSDES
ncbi:GM14000 [Drosophila sechellia]|uniref:GM14000 n=1 Tax=Drosophila sechellia TaxID=7238 RepID=B4HU20_DROSE|nr:GM14000 [Drosophila sechellia]